MKKDYNIIRITVTDERRIKSSKMAVLNQSKKNTGALKSIKRKFKDAKAFLVDKENAKKIIADYLNNNLNKNNAGQQVTSIELYYLLNRIKVKLTDGCNAFYKNLPLFHLVTMIIDKADIKQIEINQKIEEIKNYILYARLSALNNLNMNVDNKLAIIWKEIRDIEEEMNCDKYDVKIINDIEENKLNDIYTKLKSIISLDNVLWDLKQRVEIHKHKLSKDEIDSHNNVRAALLNINHQTTFLLNIYDNTGNINRIDAESLKEKAGHLLDAINISISLADERKEKA